MTSDPACVQYEAWGDIVSGNLNLRKLQENQIQDLNRADSDEKAWNRYKPSACYASKVVDALLTDLEYGRYIAIRGKCKKSTNFGILI